MIASFLQGRFSFTIALCDNVKGSSERENTSQYNYNDSVCCDGDDNGCGGGYYGEKE